MAKKIVLLTGSPRRKGNTAQMADALTAALEEKGCRVVRFDTAFLPLGGCRDCRACYRGVFFSPDYSVFPRKFPATILFSVYNVY